VWKIVDQQNVDSLYQLQARSFRPDSGAKGIEENTLTLVQRLFVESREQIFSVDDVVSATGLSKTTTRRYLEHCVESGFLTVEMLYGKIGHPRRLYRRAEEAGCYGGCDFTAGARCLPALRKSMLWLYGGCATLTCPTR
uniref:hypothetical protein n=1 Tax=Neisseria gonorrhoeae TaxID=485 RepID=UPI001C98FDE7